MAAFHDKFANPYAPFNDADIRDTVHPRPMPEFTFTIQALDAALARMANDKSPGYDGIKTIALKKMWEEIRWPLFTIMDASLLIGHYPTPWKHFITAVLCGPAKATYKDPSSCHPIALILTLAKVYYAILSDRLAIHLEATGLLPSHMFGGRRGRSTTDAVTTVTETDHDGWHKKKVVAMLSIDAQAAYPLFDTIA